ncbi:MAG: YdiU family protein [Hyphomicrobiaceae bacterium]
MTLEPPHQAFSFDNSYARLPERFFARLPPTPVSAPRLVKLNDALARDLGLDPAWLASADGVGVLAGNRVADGSEPIAQAYAGHQFGGFVPQLGDGRAVLLGEIVDSGGVRRDIQLKGSGPTPFSRRGDGRAALGPVLREYIIAEAMHALGIPTTRALAAVTTGDRVFREEALPGAVLTRVAASHIRVGTFQYFAVRGDIDAIRALADHVIARHYPQVSEAPNRYQALLEAVIARQAALVARWLGVGFIHGVMNTDNMSIAGETIDYGPCAFMDTYHPATVYSSIDSQGRYAYANQPQIAQWNLARFTETLMPLLGDDEAQQLERGKAALVGFAGCFEDAYTRELRAKLGLFEAREGDLELAHDLLDRMTRNEADMSLTFRRLSDAAADVSADAGVAELFKEASAFTEWASRWHARLEQEGGDATARRAAMRRTNPAFIPRNHRVEEAIAAAVRRDDFSAFEDLLAVLATPFDDQPGRERFAEPPKPEEVVQQTFCGT